MSVDDHATIRPLRRTDIPAVARLLERLARRSITSEFGPSASARFLEANDEPAIRGFIDKGFEYHVALIDDLLVGFVGVRDHSHLYHLFVHEHHQGKGVGRRLWEHAKNECRKQGNRGTFTVNSSNNAVAVYEAFGFRRSAKMQDHDGVLFNPMALSEPDD